jgi:hypothetical protein
MGKNGACRAKSKFGHLFCALQRPNTAIDKGCAFGMEEVLLATCENNVNNTVYKIPLLLLSGAQNVVNTLAFGF